MLGIEIRLVGRHNPADKVIGSLLVGVGSRHRLQASHQPGACCSIRPPDI